MMKRDEVKGEMRDLEKYEVVKCWRFDVVGEGGEVLEMVFGYWVLDWVKEEEWGWVREELGMEDWLMEV